MTRKERKLLMSIAIIITVLSMLACTSTLCMTNEELYDWAAGGEPRQCFEPRER